MGHPVGPLVTLDEIGKSVIKSLLLQIHQSNRNVVLLCGERIESKKNIVFTSGDGKNHEWRRPRVVFGVPTSENNVFALLKQAQ
jgi:hypothetical protein